MKLKRYAFLVIGCLSCGDSIIAQNDFSMLADKSEVEIYEWPKDPLLKEKLAAWQGQKFGLLAQIGLYSELGTVESWWLCPEEWVDRNGYDDNYKS